MSSILISSLTALLYYDYFLTFGQEVRYIWKRKFGVTTLMYICCRYSLVANVIYTLAVTNKLHSLRKQLKYITVSCTAAYQISAALSILGRLAIVSMSYLLLFNTCLIWGMRTYAVFSEIKIIMAIFGPLGLILVVLAIVHVPSVRCTGTFPKNTQL
ncbi:hypothetical protein M422DRAFT_233136 [Sphaerobolus stellatus SS14]|uniref:DUF6533 domain-containing protein n=1 Tax=Sphaerobolus stellatus (strain SS14) TaxID=990650 RepID=A0A0C9VBT9_SPHS4|nr:hypothetical protein M422DRAFT_233136 [Sphaerobolus stellatus SS14]